MIDTDEQTIFGFATDNQDEAIAALILYVVWKSRDRGKYKPGPGMWGQLRSFVKAAAKSSTNIPRFTEDLMQRLGCTSISSRWVAIGMLDDAATIDGETYVRAYLQDIRARANEKRVLDIAANETVTIIGLVQQRLDDAAAKREEGAAAAASTGQMGLFDIDPDDIIDLGEIA